GAGAAGDGVVAVIAGPGEIARSGIGQLLHVGRQRIARQGGLDRIDPLVGKLVHHVTDIVDDVGVVAEAAVHDVGAEAAVHRVVASAAIDRVGVGVAGDRVVAAAADNAVDAGVLGNGDIVDLPVNARKGAGVEVDRGV